MGQLNRWNGLWRKNRKKHNSTHISGRLYLGKRDFANAEKELKTALGLDKTQSCLSSKGPDFDLLSGWKLPYGAGWIGTIERVETLNAGQWFIRALCYDKLMQIFPALDAYHKFLELDRNQNPDQVWQANQRIHVLQKMAEKKK